MQDKRELFYNLVECVEDDEIENVKKFLEENPNFDVNFNLPEKPYSSPLTLAAFYRENELIKLLFKYGAKADFKNSNNQTPLLVSEAYLSESTVELLLKNGCSIDVTDNELNTPLHFAAGCIHKDILQSIISRIANYDPLNNKKQSPLHVAAKSGRDENVKILSEISNALKLTDVCGKTPVDYAFEHFDTNNAVIHLLDKLPEYKDQTPLEIAVTHGNKTAIGILSANPDSLESPSASSALQIAIEAQDTESVTALKLAIDSHIELKNLSKKNKTTSASQQI